MPKKVFKFEDRLLQKINSFKDGELFTYKMLGFKESEFKMLAKCLSHLTKKKVVIRFSKGIYYKSLEGLISNQQLLSFINAQKRCITISSSNNVITAASPCVKRNTMLGGVSIKFVKREFITKRNISYIMLLDKIKKVNNFEKEYLTLASEIRNLKKNKRQELTKLALRYNPRTRVILGIILEEIKERRLARSLRDSLNPLTRFKLVLPEAMGVNSSQWNIVSKSY